MSTRDHVRSVLRAASSVEGVSRLLALAEGLTAQLEERGDSVQQPLTELEAALADVRLGLGAVHLHGQHLEGVRPPALPKVDPPVALLLGFLALRAEAALAADEAAHAADESLADRLATPETVSAATAALRRLFIEEADLLDELLVDVSLLYARNPTLRGRIDGALAELGDAWRTLAELDRRVGELVDRVDEAPSGAWAWLTALFRRTEAGNPARMVRLLVALGTLTKA